MCLTKIPTYGIFKLVPFIYFQNMCIVTRNFRHKIGVLFCFLNGFGIAVSVFIY